MLAGDFGALEEQASAQLEQDGFGADTALIERAADCRYVGQGYELRIPLPAGPIDEEWRTKVRETFHDYHERRYYRAYRDAVIQIVNIHVVGLGRLPEPRAGRAGAGREPRPGGSPDRRGQGGLLGARRHRGAGRRRCTTAPDSWRVTAWRDPRSSSSWTRRR